VPHTIDEISDGALRAHAIGQRLITASPAEVAKLSDELRGVAADLHAIADRLGDVRDLAEFRGFGGGPA